MMRFFTRILPIFGLLMMLSSQGIAQRGVCGTPDEVHSERYLKNIETIRKGVVRTRGAITYIPIKYISGARTNGTGRVNDADILTMHCKLNRMYEGQDIQFYIKDGTFTYIDSDAFYNDHRSTEAIVMNLNQDKDAISVFIVKDASNGGNTAGTTLGYYTSGRDWMVIRTDQVNEASQTLPHEIAHFFSVQHPHVGWEPDPFGPGDMGWPIAPPSPPAPGSAATEFADGSNCMTAGDLLCDTPADYNCLEISGCTYNIGAKDPNGMIIDPDESLIMAYVNDVCASKFTDSQKDLIIADLQTSDRDRLNIGSFTPVATTIGKNIHIISPAATVPFSGGTVMVNWADVSGATHYVLEVSTNPNFSNKESFLFEGSSYELTNINPGTKYYYRIKPWNLAVVCEPFSKTFSFQTTASSVSSADEISFVKNFSVFPNPVEQDGQFFVSVVSGESFEGEVSVFDLTGRKVYAQDHSFKQGDNQFAIEMNTDLSGIYFLFIKTESGVLKQKFVVAN